LTLSTVARRGSAHVETEFADQVLMMSLDQGKYYAVAATGKRIWDLLADPMALGEVCDALEAEFDVSPEVCRNEVLAFAEHLLRNGLIEIGSA
jgi:hypothetical protein